jgi:hypothetical protein
MDQQPEFDQFVDKNPRPTLPPSLNDFFTYAKKRYSKHVWVNMEHADCPEEQEANAEAYIEESAEALLLYKEYLQEKQ